MTKKRLERAVGRKVGAEEFLTAELVLPTMSDFMDEDEFLKSFKDISGMCDLVSKMADVIEELLTMVNVQSIALKKLEVNNHENGK